MSLYRGTPWLTAALLACLAAWPAGSAAEIIGGSGCTGRDRAADGSYRQAYDAVDVTGQLAGTPPRVQTEIGRGEQGQACVGFQNRTGDPIDLEIVVSDVDVDADGLPASGAEDAEFGASSWLTPSASRVRGLAHGEIAWILVDVDVPTDAVAGSSYASVTAQQVVDGGASREGATVQTVPAVAIQLFFDVTGNLRQEGTIARVDAPRVIWWDGLDLGKVPVLDDLRGLGVASVEFDWKNTGNRSDDIGGALVIESDLSGKDVATITFDDRVVLRGATREFRVTWSRDIPFFGRFTPTVKVVDSAGRAHVRELDPIWVIPSWWYLLALALAIALPVWWRRRSRERYRALLARVEAAEARAADETLDDWDDSST